ncbi:hypothetical protein Ctha_1435 [Chloroherpeton thalassium ATCC 35110]|uniref:HicB family protein n=2 Tax=Chloroherpeton thalassium TaxID=100716 RepID=B3QRU4_CHLT3|nr:hypothetical protein Ctha_1435 [Chloroherpeton thalassium ATCC 35110]
MIPSLFFNKTYIIMKLIIEKDGEGYLAKIEGHENLFAFAYSEKEAIIELKNVVEMIMDYHLEQINEERIIRNRLISTVEKYAVQV